MEGDPLRKAIEEAFVVERQGWASERVERVTARLQRDVAVEERFETLVVWTDEYNAFTAQGRTIYLSRRLLERLDGDDAAAFIVAHELAHHRLGHIPEVPRSWLGVARLTVIWLQQRWITLQAREHDADLLAIEMCMDAGYEVERCLSALEVLMQVLLDYGDVDGVLGPEGGSRAARSHPAMSARIAAVRAHVAQVRCGARLPLDITRERERKRRRRLSLALGGGAVAVAAFVVFRRWPRL